ncbi:endonuclease NucS domain-containing protein [Halovivax gelatinilyticus]|uniref:endonuclease NucS domain-containing protein n=1 Tax=Halovivax gelatinilyticus TaxID=2961597 RepID=UPI0020CA87BC|nr:endonuclease NucS domain-containing protein [Halovivax gelatinilyticus]
MPIEFGLWRIDGDERRLSSTKLDQESRLEDLIEKDPNLLGRDLLIIGRQVRTASGNFIDLLGIDADGDLHVIELKRDRTPRDVVAQALDYASWVRGQTYNDIKEIHDSYADGEAFESAFGERFNSARPEDESGVPEDVNQRHTVTIVSSELDAATERIIQYLSEEYSVPINAVRFNYYEDNNREYIGRTWLIDPKETSEQPGKKESWNGRDYYVSFGESPQRSWEDARKYGFISGGQGEWYSRTLGQLSPGDRVFVHAPSEGYVGVGEVTREKTPVKEFTVDEDGERSILKEDLDADRIDENMEDPEQREYLVGVDWTDTRPISEAYWETGMYANQNTVTKLRNQFTLNRLYDVFDVSE